jgi:hypothetical protein
MKRDVFIKKFCDYAPIAFMIFFLFPLMATQWMNIFSIACLNKKNWKTYIYCENDINFMHSGEWDGKFSDGKFSEFFSVFFWVFLSDLKLNLICIHFSFCTIVYSVNLSIKPSVHSV